MNRLALLAVLALAGCMDPHEPLSADFGNSVRANIQAQLVNPEPNYSSAFPETDGQRIENAIRRYRTNRVFPPRPESGTTFAAGSTPTAAPAAAP